MIVSPILKDTGLDPIASKEEQQNAAISEPGYIVDENKSVGIYISSISNMIAISPYSIYLANPYISHCTDSSGYGFVNYKRNVFGVGNYEQIINGYGAHNQCNMSWYGTKDGTKFTVRETIQPIHYHNYVTYLANYVTKSGIDTYGPNLLFSLGNGVVVNLVKWLRNRLGGDLWPLINSIRYQNRWSEANGPPGECGPTTDYYTFTHAANMVKNNHFKNGQDISKKGCNAMSVVGWYGTNSANDGFVLVYTDKTNIPILLINNYNGSEAQLIFWV